MTFIKEKIYNIFKWDLKELLKSIIGIFLFSIAINLFIVPNNLYNGGVLGISQLLRTLIVNIFDLNMNFDISGILNFLINVPLFILAYHKISKSFFSRTLLCVLLQTIFLTFIPTLEVPLVNELITSVLIGGILAGIGCGMTLSAGASGGGTDIIGIVISEKSRKLSVGKIGLAVNIVIYSICGILYGIEIMIYSIIYTVFTTLMVDNTHEQNICSTAIVFTKTKPTKLIKFVKEELNRDVTYWEAVGGYSSSKTYISYIVLSKYELQRLERNISDIDKGAFIVKSDGVGIDGNFKKVLTK